MDRYNHDLDLSEGGGSGNTIGDDTDDTADDSPLFGSFNSYSPHYRKQYSSTSSLVSCGSPSNHQMNQLMPPTTATVTASTPTKQEVVQTTETSAEKEVRF